MKKIKFNRNHVAIGLTCLGSIGVIATTVLAVKATPKALGLIDKAKKESDDELSKWDVVKTAYKPFIPVAVSGVTTIFCIFSAEILNQRQQASIMSAYAFLDQSYKKYRRKLIELYGEEQHNEIVKAIAAEDAEERYIHAFNMFSDCTQFLEEDFSEPILFYDEFGHRYFNAPIEQVLQAEYHLNRNYCMNAGVYLNEFYNFLGIDKTEYGDQVGWVMEDESTMWIDFNHRKITMDDGLECYAIEMVPEPMSNCIICQSGLLTRIKLSVVKRNSVKHLTCRIPIFMILHLPVIKRV